MLELLEEERRRDASGQAHAEAAEETEVLAELARAGIVDVDEAEELVIDDERHADLAAEAVLPVDYPLPLRQLRVVRARHHEQPALRDVGDQRRVQRNIEEPAGGLVVEAAAVVAHHAAQTVVREAVDVAVGNVESGEQALRRVAEHGVEITARRGERPYLDELVQDAAPALHQLKETGVLERLCRHSPEAADEFEVRGEIAGDVVRQLHQADDATRRDQRYGELRLIAPSLKGGASVDAEDLVLEARRDGDLTTLDRAPADRIAGEGYRDASPFRVETARVVADQGAQGATLDGVDVGDGTLCQVRQALEDGVQDLVRAQPRGVLDPGARDGLEVVDSPFER